ncbi:MAG: ABC transporter permease [Eubacteriales bacterium]|nr:ABC transporter permease [Eubacteriales bacterium]
MKKRKIINRKKSLYLRLGILGTLAGGLTLLSLAAPLAAPNDPYATSALYMNKPPSGMFPMGTDRYGRCVFSRILMGARTSIWSAVSLVLIMFLVGTALGMLCGYYGGVLDNCIMRLADILLAFPQMVLAIAVAGILGGGIGNAMIALGVTGWTLYARLARSQTMALKEEAYVLAARMGGSSGVRILMRHIFPNIAGSLAVNAAAQLGTVMIGIAGLSFLGIGVVPPQAEWGSMINESRAYMQLAPWAVLFPAGAILVTVMVFNYLGDTVRDLAAVEEYSQGAQ